MSFEKAQVSRSACTNVISISTPDASAPRWRPHCPKLAGLGHWLNGPVYVACTLFLPGQSKMSH